MSDTKKSDIGDVNWDQVAQWDTKYYLHGPQAAGEANIATIASMDGNWFTLADGTRMLDFQSQLISDSFGHRHPAIHAKIEEAMSRTGHAFYGFANQYRAEAAKLMIEGLFPGEDWAGRVRVFASGTDAVESAINMARLHTGRAGVLTQAHSFHGMVMGSTMVRGYRNNITHADDLNTVRDTPGFPPQGYIPVPAPEHEDFPVVEGQALPSLAATEEIIRAVGPENIAAMIAEPMLGAGGTFPHPQYMADMAAMLKKYGILWISDEVITGIGRLGEWFGYQSTPGVAPDLIACGKGLTGCVMPVGAVIASKEIAEPFENARWWSGSTWDGHPLVCAAIVGALEWAFENDILQSVRQKGAHLNARLNDLKDKHDCVGRVAGRGLYQTLDLVGSDGTPIIEEDRFHAFTGDTSSNPNSMIYAECAAHGVYLGGYTPNTVKVGPPFTITSEEIDLAMDALDSALTKVGEKWHK